MEGHQRGRSPPVITKFLQSRNLSPLTCLSTVKPINTLNSQSQSLQRSALRFCSQPDHQRVQAHAFRHALHSLIATVLAKQPFLRSFPQDSSPDQGLEERMPLKSHASRDLPHPSVLQRLELVQWLTRQQTAQVFRCCNPLLIPI